MREAFVERLSELAEKNPRIFLITGDLGFGVLTQFAERFPRHGGNLRELLFELYDLYEQRQRGR